MTWPASGQTQPNRTGPADCRYRLQHWWDKWLLNYPQVSLLAKWLLGIPASSATSERIFSSTGRVLEARRQNLSGDAVNDILFLRKFRNI